MALLADGRLRAQAGFDELTRAESRKVRKLFTPQRTQDISLKFSQAIRFIFCKA